MQAEICRVDGKLMEQISSELPWKQIENQNAVLCAVGSWEVAGLVALGLYRFKMYKLYMIMRSKL